MKLTTHMRDMFVTKALQDVPKINYSELILKTATEIAVKTLPPKIRAIWNDPELRGFIKVRSQNLNGDCYAIPGDYTSEVGAEMSAATAHFEAADHRQTEARTELRAKLRAVAFSASTRAQLAELLPDFEKYLPEDNKAALRDLPTVTDVMSSFKEAGWPA